ncbi:hypothetical protein MMC11_005395 [Xylographa trunciseda]|nr:hypothetical protein [Xylographa trunciseda]
MRSFIFLGLAGLATVALARMPLNQRSEDLDIYARDAEPDYGHDLSERDEKLLLAQLYARDLGYDLVEREADPYEDDEPLGLFVRMDHGIFDNTASGSHSASVGKGDHVHTGPGIMKTSSFKVSSSSDNPEKHDPHHANNVPFHMPARADSEPVKYKLVGGKAVRQKRSVYDEYYGY